MAKSKYAIRAPRSAMPRPAVSGEAAHSAVLPAGTMVSVELSSGEWGSGTLSEPLRVAVDHSRQGIATSDGVCLVRMRVRPGGRIRIPASVG